MEQLGRRNREAVELMAQAGWKYGLEAISILMQTAAPALQPPVLHRPARAAGFWWAGLCW